jgi:DNA polymerase-3 subunit delta'
MALSQIIGHTRPLAMLRRALGTGRIAHAYLFAGPDGIGKATVARGFAKALLCHAGEEDACQACDACRKVAHGNHPDLVLLAPQEAQIVIGQVREIQRQMIHRPLEGPWRVVIVDQAHDLNLQAANALLKILEEPPEGNVVVLIARSVFALLATIVSRCQVVHFSPLGEAEVARYLGEREGLAPEEGSRVASQSQGSIQRALELRECPVQQEGEALVGFLEALGGMRGSELLGRARQWAGERQEVILRLEFLQRIFRDMVLLHLGSRAVQQRDSQGPLARMASAWSIQDLLQGWEATVEALRGLERNWNPQLVLDHLFLQLHELNPKESDGGKGMRAPVYGERA